MARAGARSPGSRAALTPRSRESETPQALGPLAVNPSQIVPARDHLAATIGILAAEHGAPRFEPHVTMAGRFHSGEQAATRALTSITAGVHPFEVKLVAVGHEQAYFRALYLRAEPSPQLTALHETARAAWALDARPYTPHLSLLYANIADERKRAIIDALDIPLPLTIQINAAELWADHQTGVPGWHRVARVPFSRHTFGIREERSIRLRQSPM